MGDFVRARSSSQKEERMREIMNAAEKQFAEKPYHEITLTTIADQLSWSRANLYKYVTTKEEIFLELARDKWAAYLTALKAAFPPECGYSAEVAAEVWAGILNGNKEHLKYAAILSSIIETNVSMEKLAAFKKFFHQQVDLLTDLFHRNFGFSREKAYEIFMNVHYQAVGMYGYCNAGPQVTEALRRAGVKLLIPDFRERMKTFIYMNLNFALSEK
ncbi:MAG TPA: TetR family transcriptional regulator [Candidatus Blautia excrementipullorum]|nr:TetR family transcriptional regulator [Candidatus Blautia excrementipullorum]